MKLFTFDTSGRLNQVESMNNIVSLLANHGVPTIKMSYTDDYDKRYEHCIVSHLVHVDSGYTRKMKVRIYFSVDGKRNVFMQSDDESNVDVKALIKKALELTEEEQVRQDRDFQKRIDDSAMSDQARIATNVLKGTGFEVRYNGRGRFEVTASAYSDSDMYKLVAKITK